MSEGFDSRKSQIGRKQMVAFLDADITDDLKMVFLFYYEEIN